MGRLLALALLLAPVSAQARRVHRVRRVHHVHHRHLRHVAIWHGTFPVRPMAPPAHVELPSRPQTRAPHRIVLAGLPYVGPPMAGAGDALHKWQYLGQ